MTRKAVAWTAVIATIATLAAPTIFAIEKKPTPTSQGDRASWRSR